METLGQRIKVFVKTIGTQEEVATRAGTTNVTISRYINGDREPSLEFITFLAENGCNLNWLFKGEGSMRREEEGNAKIVAEIRRLLDKTEA